MLKVDLTKLADSVSNMNITELVADQVHDIAIIGMAAKLPQADNIGEYWENLRSGRDCVSDFPPARKGEMELYLRHAGETVAVKYKRGSYLERVDEFDCRFFNISPREASLMDPNQRLFLEIALSAIEDAGYSVAKLKGSQTGVYCGFVSDLAYQRLIMAIEPSSVGSSIPGNLAAVIPGRVSYLFDLKGPSILIDTACSSSLVAVHTACQALRNGDCDLAIAGSVKINLLPLEDGNMLGIESKEYICRAFDDEADGTCMGEGVMAIVLKPLAKAVKDKDHIYAVIKGSAVNQDGTSLGITAPNALAQAEVIEKAWRDGGIAPETITYIEAHGTGTKLGDPIEIDGINRAFSKYTSKKRFCAIGSVKTNLGHLDSAAGMAGLIKAALALKHKQIPPSLHFNKPNRNIDFENSPVYVIDRLSGWETDGFPRRCGVSAFGMSGTNSHIILEEAPVLDRPAVPREVNGPFQVFTLSAKNNNVLQKMVEEYLVYLTTGLELDLEDLCYTVNTGRNHYQYRLALVATDLTELTEKLAYLKQTGLNTDEDRGIYHWEMNSTTLKSGPASGKISVLESKSLALPPDALVRQLNDNRNEEGSVKELARLYVQGADLDWDKLYGSGDYRRLSLPTYPFERERHWLEILPKVKNPEDASQEPEFEINLNPPERPEVSNKAAKVILTGRKETDYSNIEVQIARVWGEVLGFETINVDDDFYDLGGDSILAVQMTEKLNELNLNVSVSDILTHKTVAQIAANIGPDIQLSAPPQNGADSENVTEYSLFYNLKDFQTYQVDQRDHKELKITLQNEITTYLCHSLPLCVVLSDERLLPWFYEHFINIYAMIDDNSYLKLEFLEYRAPYKEVMHEVYLGYHFLEKESNIIDFIIDKINKGYYLIIHVDEYYLPVKYSYQKEHFVHHSIIYGYDNKARQLLAIGFNAEQLFARISFDYEDFITAYENGKLYYHISAPWAVNNAVELLKLKDYPEEYPFDIQRFLLQLGQYLAGAGDDSVIFTYMTDRKTVTYGLNVYDEIVNHLENLLQGVISIDYRAVHLLAEHKRGMLGRLRYISANCPNEPSLGSLIQEYLPIVEQVESIRKKFLDLSYSINNNQSSLTNIPVIIKDTIASIHAIKTMEQQVLKDIYHQLQTQVFSCDKTGR